MTDLLIDQRGTVLCITFNRPAKRNALTLEMYAALADAVENARETPDIHAILLIGAGDAAFAAGTDISVFRDFGTAQQALDYEALMDRVMDALESSPKPVIAAVTGACTGGGAAIANAADIRIGSENLRYGFPIARTLGNNLSIANLSRFAALVGVGRAREMMLTGRLMSAQQALAVGVITEALPTARDCQDHAFEIAQSLSESSPATIALTKTALRRLRVDGASAPDRDLITQGYTGDDFREGVNAFLAKCRPSWHR